MDGDGGLRRPAQGDFRHRAMVPVDWRTAIPWYARPEMVNKIMDTLQRYFPMYEPENVGELMTIARTFEEKTFRSSASQVDYLWTIYLKIDQMKSIARNPRYAGVMAADRNIPEEWIPDRNTFRAMGGRS